LRPKNHRPDFSSALFRIFAMEINDYLNMQENTGVDFVITWVDMDDPRWVAEFERYSGRSREPNATSVARFRDHGFLRYWFRGVERFAPWVRRIHFVTCGQKPEWLDASHPKLSMVNHEDYIPREFLPCFNSNVLEYYMHRIPGLTERFVYFNDDFFITAPTGVERFFREGLPCDIAAFKINFGESQWGRMLRENIKLINKHFSKREVMRLYHDKWFDPSFGSRARWNRLLRWYPRFVTLRTPHNAQPYLRSTFEAVWAACGEELTACSAHRFRTERDLTPELFKTWQCCTGQFTPYNTYQDTKMFPLVLRARQAIEAVAEQKYKLVCLNDNVHIRNYEQVMHDIGASFEKILPKKSSFEI
jgi:hypothetical protein